MKIYKKKRKFRTFRFEKQNIMEHGWVDDEDHTTIFQ